MCRPSPGTESSTISWDHTEATEEATEDLSHRTRSDGLGWRSNRWTSERRLGAARHKAEDG
jgi:hypothetical protein